MKTWLALPLFVLACSTRAKEPAPNPGSCPVERCGPALGMPNSPCEDGTTIAGPSGRCLPSGDGCAWEVIECPAAGDDAPAPSADGCKRTGCSGQICADEDRVSDCMFRPEYACYADAECKRQADGACGWTPSAALDACLADPPAS